MKKTILSTLFLCLLTWPIQAAVDVRMQGSIYAEIASEPGDVLRAGTRLQLYSELASSGATFGKIRLIGFNQKTGELNRFASTSYLRLDNLINWAEVQLKGNIFPQGPEAVLSIGNVEVDYSPYTISLRDDLLNYHHSSYLNRPGVAIKDLNVGGFDGAGFILWGFEDPLKNAMGGKVSKKIGQTTFSGIIVDYRNRSADAQKNILESFNQNQQLTSALEWEQTKSLELEQKIGALGSFRVLIANQEQKNYRRVMNQDVEIVIEDSVLRNYEWGLPITNEIDLLVGYRDIPVGFDPIFRDRTPEFDAQKGYYLGYNPIDRYKDRAGFYSKIKAQKDMFKLAIEIEDLKDHQVLPTNYRIAKVALVGQVSSYQVDFFSQLKQRNSWFSTGIRNALQEGFTRLILTRPVIIGKTPLLAGLEFLKQGDASVNRNQGTLFARYQKSDYLTVDAGVIQAFSKGATGGGYWGFNYKAPNGLEFRYRHAYPTVISDGKLLYDPDYRLREEGNIAQMSVNIKF